MLQDDNKNPSRKGIILFFIDRTNSFLYKDFLNLLYLVFSNSENHIKNPPKEPSRSRFELHALCINFVMIPNVGPRVLKNLMLASKSRRRPLLYLYWLFMSFSKCHHRIRKFLTKKQALFPYILGVHTFTKYLSIWAGWWMSRGWVESNRKDFKLILLSNFSNYFSPFESIEFLNRMNPNGINFHQIFSNIFCLFKSIA